MLSAAEKAAVRDSWQLMTPVADAAADLFYRRLTQHDPGLRPSSHEDLAARKKELVALLDFVVRALDWHDADWREDVDDDYDLFVVMLRMGQSYPPFARLMHEHYSAVGEALVGALGSALGPRFDAKTRKAWSRLYALLANAVRMGRLSAQSNVRAEQEEHPPSDVSTLRRGAAS